MCLGGTKRGKSRPGATLGLEERSKARKVLVVKLVRAFGGCLGAKRRRRTWLAAKSHGELQASVDPWISEWGNPHRVMSMEPGAEYIGSG
jgi:hypothetical protein